MIGNFAKRLTVSAPTGARSMATLKDIELRLKSVKNMSKVTGSMKMVSSAKYARAEKQLKLSRPTGPATMALLNKNDVVPVEEGAKRLYIAVSSDRGLCGGIHSGVGKYLRRDIAALPASTDFTLAILGDKVRGLTWREFTDKYSVTSKEMGRKPTTFGECSFCVQAILKSTDFTEGKIVFNTFKNAAQYEVGDRPVLGLDLAIANQEALAGYENFDEESLRSYTEFNLASSLFYTMLENVTSEQSSRMTAMENATKNADEMQDKLRTIYNRTRQAVITTELIEIISGASAME